MLASLDQGDILYKEGLESDYMYILVKGSLDVHKKTTSRILTDADAKAKQMEQSIADMLGVIQSSTALLRNQKRALKLTSEKSSRRLNSVFAALSSTKPSELKIAVEKSKEIPRTRESWEERSYRNLNLNDAVVEDDSEIDQGHRRLSTYKFSNKLITNKIAGETVVML
jgi:hypothetical protein